VTVFRAHSQARKIFELALEITEGDGLCDAKMLRCAGEMSGHDLWLAGRVKFCTCVERVIQRAQKPVEALIHSSYAFKAGNHFLSNVATFIKIHPRDLEAGFLRQCVFIEFMAPSGNSMVDAQKFDDFVWKFGEIIRFLWCVESWNSDAVNCDTALGGFPAENMIARRCILVKADCDIIRNDVALESHLDGLSQFGLGFYDKLLVVLPNKNAGAELSFSGEEAGGSGEEWLKAGYVNADLAIEVTLGVWSAENQC
jgi:hypothetical protein